MLTMTITQDATGRDHAEAVVEGVPYRAASRSGVTMKLARALRDAGVADGEFEVVGADGRSRFTTNATLHEWATFTMTEGDATRARIAKFVDIGALHRGAAE